MEHEIGDILYITITGTSLICKSRVVGGGTSESPRLKILDRDDHPSMVWPVLKPGDYVIWTNQEQRAREYQKALERESSTNIPSKKMAIKYGILFVIILIAIFLIFFLLF